MKLLRAIAPPSRDLLGGGENIHFGSSLAAILVASRCGGSLSMTTKALDSSVIQGEPHFFFVILSELSNANEVEWISDSFA